MALMHHLAEHGSDGFVVAATTGEAATLTDEEQLALIELAVAERPPGKTIVAGAGTNDTRHAVYLTERASALGPDAIISVTPYYNRPSPLGLKRHYEAVAAATDKPILLYNIPARTGTNIGPELLAELAQIDGIEGVKQANADELQLIEGLELYAGDDSSFARTLDIGGAGGVCVASHVVGNEMRRMVDEPEQRAEIDASLQRRLQDAVPDLEPHLHEGGAEPARPPRRRRAPADRRGHCRGARGGAGDARAPRAARRRRRPSPAVARPRVSPA